MPGKTKPRVKSKAKSAPKTRAKTKARAKAAPRSKATPSKTRKSKKVVLLSGGNPQIAKGSGDAPVKAFIAAMPDWKRAIGRRLDALIVKNVPKVRKAVKWNSPFYGAPDRQDWFLSFHVFARYVKVTFLRGASLKPPPPGPSKHPAVRYLDIHEGEFDATQLSKWVKQAAAMPGEAL